MIVSLRLNGEQVRVDAPAASLLIDALRSLGLTGTKEGCGVGVCGLCSVLVNDQPVSSCIYLLGAAAGCDVWTIEGLAERFPEIVESFVSHEGMQCGICTPGQLVAVSAFHISGGIADEEQVKEYLNGNLCRCTGYQTIVAAAIESLKRLQ